MRTSVEPHGNGWDVRSAAGLHAHYPKQSTAQSVAARLDGRLAPDMTLPTAKLPSLQDDFQLAAPSHVRRNHDFKRR